MKQYAYSTCEERYYGTYDNIEDALDEGIRENEDSEVIFIGEIVPHVYHVDIDNIIEGLQERAMEECGEEAWLNGVEEIKELEKQVNEVVFNFIEKHDKPKFYSIENSKKYNCKTKEPMP